MQATKETIIDIWPQTHVRSTKGDSWLFAVSEDYLQEYDIKRTLADPDAKPGRNMNRKRQLEKYNSYKEELRWKVAKMNFKMPMGYFAIWFCIPFPKSWWPRKSKCNAMNGKPHQGTPDCDNLLKAFFDGVLPRRNKSKGEKGIDDRKIHCYAAFKIWVPQDQACIKIVEYDQNEFIESFVPPLVPGSY